MNTVSRFISSCATAFLVSSCGSSLPEEKKAEAESLVVANVICEVLGNYRISTMRLNLMPPQQHREMAYAIYDGAGISSFSLVGSGGEAAGKGLDDLISMLDIAFKEDLQKLTSQLKYDRDDINNFANKFFGVFQSELDKHYGYSYPDCEMAYSISEAFFVQNL